MADPCPFCGENDPDMLTVTLCIGTNQGTWRGYCECENCGASGPSYWHGETKDGAREGAVYLWNETSPIRSRAIRAFCASACISGSVEAAHIPDDVKSFRMRAAVEDIKRRDARD